MKRVAWTIDGAGNAMIATARSVKVSMGKGDSMRSVRRVLSVLLAAALMTPVVSAAGLQSIRSVSFADASNGYMGGYNAVGGTTGDLGFISVTQDGGATWRSVRIAGPLSSIVSVAPGDVQNPRAVATFDPFPYKSGTFGASWSKTAASLPGDQVQAAAVERFAGGRTVAVGKYSGSQGGGTGLYGVIIASDNGDTNWTRKWYGPPYPATETDDQKVTNADMRDVDTFGPDRQVGWAVGNERTPNTGGNTTTYKEILIFKTTDGGQTWTKQTPPTISGLNDFAITSVVAVNSNVAFAAGNYRYVMKTTNGGTSWTGQALPTAIFGGSPSGAKVLNDIAAWDANTVVAVGADGWIARTANGGATWTGVQMPEKRHLRSVAVITASNWIAAGDNETVYRTTDGGANWTAVSAGAAAPTVSITAPAAGFSIAAGSPVSVAGTASDLGVGVAGAEVSIRRADGRYFDGSSWVTSERWLTAASSNGGRNWTYAWTPDSTTVAGGQVWIRARAMDGLRNYATPKEVASTNVRKATGFTSLGYRKTPAYGEASYLSGVLVSGTQKLSGRNVTLQRLSNRTSGTWVNVGTPKPTNSTGYVRFDIPAGKSGYNYTKTVYRLMFNGAAGYSASPSASRTILPKASLGKPWSSSTTIRSTRSHTWYSSIKPRHTAGSKSVKLQFQRLRSGNYRTYKTVSATAYNYSSYSRVKLKIKLPYKGSWRVRAVHSDTGHATSYSSWYKFKVK